MNPSQYDEAIALWWSHCQEYAKTFGCLDFSEPYDSETYKYWNVYGAFEAGILPYHYVQICQPGYYPTHAGLIHERIERGILEQGTVALLPSI